MDTKRFLVFYQSFSRIVKDIKRLEMSFMSKYGLRSTHLSCLLYIGQSEKGMTVSQLTRACKIDKALISRVVKELVANGTITTKSSDKTYNKKYILTQSGEEIIADLTLAISEYMASARKDIPEDDLATFYEVLDTLEKNISLIANN